MTSDLRQQLRHAIDQHARTRMAAQKRGVCAGCGTDRDLKTKGCKRCSDRHLKWAYRSNPDYIARELERQRQRNVVRVARQKARRAKDKAMGSVSLPSRPAGSSLSGYQPSESPVGRTLSPVESMSAGNRQLREES